MESVAAATVPSAEAVASPATSAAASASPPAPRLARLPGISQSCLRLAALRAEELAVHGSSALVHDRLAAKLAGADAMRRVDTAPFVCRKVRLEKEERPNGDAQAAAAASASSSVECIASSASSGVVDSSASVAAPIDRAAVRAALVNEVAAFNQARSEAPDTMIRARYLDDVIAEHCGNGDGDRVQQLVLLGAGMDTRAYRLPCLSSVRIFELDVPAVLEYKASLLADQPLVALSITRVPTDFSQLGGPVCVSKSSQVKNKAQKRARAQLDSSSVTPSPSLSPDASSASSPSPSPSPSAPQLSFDSTPPPWALGLFGGGFDPALPTLWVAEGLLMYLGHAQVSNLLGWMAHLASAAPAASPSAASSSSSAAPTPSSHHLVCDVMNEHAVRSKLKWYRFFRWGAAREGTHPLAIEPFLRAAGWQIEPVSPTALPLTGYDSPSSTLPPSLHIHPIGRSGLSYGRYLAAPLMDSTTRPHLPPVLLESYVIRARVLAKRTPLRTPATIADDQVMETAVALALSPPSAVP